jgi:hypothetical protein
MSDNLIQTCPLCGSAEVADYCQDNLRKYFQCRNCKLIFADPASHISPEAEKARYSKHQNSPHDQKYRQFLHRLIDPLVERLDSGALTGLDFGCGPGPTLSVILEEMGYSMSLYDQYFVKDDSVLSKKYDFVTCTETIEHFNTPCKQWPLLLNLLKPSGWLAIMTRLTNDVKSFTQWDYRNDLTHVSFFSRETFQYLADRDNLHVEFFGNDVILLKKTV